VGSSPSEAFNDWRWPMDCHVPRVRGITPAAADRDPDALGVPPHRREAATESRGIVQAPLTAARAWLQIDASPVQGCQAADRANRDNGPCSCPDG